MTQKPKRVSPKELTLFCAEILHKLGVRAEDAKITADVLVKADLRGIDSHGVARMTRYVTGIQQGMMKTKAQPKTLCDTPCTATIDADAGLGQPVSYRAMSLAIEKASRNSLGFVAVKNSNHYGIAGYYAMMALKRDMIGICSTNTEVLVVPTYARDAVLGTNPIAIAVPAGKEKPYVLDMSTATVTRGKLEVYARLEKPVPLSWATDERGLPTDDPRRVLKNFINRSGGGLLPLGGALEETGGHKGYGLALAVEVFSAVLPGALYAKKVYPKDSQGLPLPSGIGHFFGAMRIDAFRPKNEFKKDMDDLICTLRNAPKAEGAPRIYIHGEKEFEEEKNLVRSGIPLLPKVATELKNIGKELGISGPFK